MLAELSNRLLFTIIFYDHKFKFLYMECVDKIDSFEGKNDSFFFSLLVLTEGQHGKVIPRGQSVGFDLHGADGSRCRLQRSQHGHQLRLSTFRHQLHSQNRY